jgi:predicted nucleic acid-binding protein
MKQMQDKTFVDSNIFLYAFSDLDTKKQKIASQIVSKRNFISIQVLNEVSNNLLKKLKF